MPLQPARYIDDSDNINESLMVHDIVRFYVLYLDRYVPQLKLARFQWPLSGTIRRSREISETQLAEYLNVKPATVTRTPGRMERAGWIERQPESYCTNKLPCTWKRRETLSGVTPQVHQALVKMLRKTNQALCKKKNKAPK